MKNNARIKEIALFSVILTFFVMGIHILSEPVNLYIKGSNASILFFSIQKLMSFVVPAFIFLSGLRIFLSLKNKTDIIFDYKNFMIKRFTKIYLQYFIFTNIFYFYFIDREFVVLSLSGYIKYLLLGNVVSHLYFVIIIFQFYILMPFFIKIKKMNILFIASSFLLMIACKYLVISIEWDNFIWNFVVKYSDRIFIFYIFYWILGIYCSIFYEKFKAILCNNKIILTIMYFLVLIIHISLSYLQFIGKYGYVQAEFVHGLFCTFSLLWFYMLTIEISKISNELFNKIINKVDNISLYIYFSHPLFIYMADHRLYNNGVNNITERLIYRAWYVVIWSFIFSVLYWFILFGINKVIKTIKKLVFSKN